MHKLEALTRLLEAEPFEAMIIFVRTKTATAELAEKLEARGYAAAALNGDIVQKQRERTVENLKKGKLDIIIATDVAARGLDVERISHVINYDIPYDTEAYVHRIGRTGRAGRSGDAILFVAPRERRLLNAIEKATRQKIELLQLPSTEDINDQRVARFKQRITDTLATEELELYTRIIEQYQQEHDVPAVDIAAALAKQVQGDIPLLFTKPIKQRIDTRPGRSGSADRTAQGRSRSERLRAKGGTERKRSVRTERGPQPGMERFRIEVGNDHGVRPGNIVGAIANEAGLDSEFIGHIAIHENYSFVDLPENMPDDVFRDLKKVWVSGQRLKIIRTAGSPADKTRTNKTKSGKAKAGHSKVGVPGKKRGTGKHGKPAKKKTAKKKSVAEKKPRKKLALKTGPKKRVARDTG